MSPAPPLGRGRAGLYKEAEGGHRRVRAAAGRVGGTALWDSSGWGREGDASPGVPAESRCLRCREDHESSARLAAGAGRARGGCGRAHLSLAGRRHGRVAGVPPVPPWHLRAAAVPPGRPHTVRRLPAAPLHAVLELPGALPLLQRHLRGARGGGTAVRRHPQPRLPLPPGLLRARWLLPGARALPAGRGHGHPRHPQPEHAVPAVSPGHLLSQQLQLRAVPAPPQLHRPRPSPQRPRLLLPRRPVHQLLGLPSQHAGAGGARTRGVRARPSGLRGFPGHRLEEAPAVAGGPCGPGGLESGVAEGGPRSLAAEVVAAAHGAPRSAAWDAGGGASARAARGQAAGLRTHCPDALLHGPLTASLIYSVNRPPRRTKGY